MLLRRWMWTCFLLAFHPGNSCNISAKVTCVLFTLGTGCFSCYFCFTLFRLFNAKSWIKVFQTIVFIFIVISTIFWLICPPAFFRCLSNSETFTELRTSWVRQTPEEGWRTYRPKRCGNNNKDEDNSPKNLNDKNQQASSQKFRQQTPDEGRRTYWPKRCGNNNKDEDNSLKNLNDKNQHASSQKFRHLIVLFSHS